MKKRLFVVGMMAMALLAGCSQKTAEETGGQNAGQAGVQTEAVSEAAGDTSQKAQEEKASEAGKEAEYIFKFAHVGPAQGVEQTGSLYLGEKLKEYSGGRIIQETYPAGQLAEKQSALEGLQLGTIEITELAATDLAQFDDIWDVFALPYLFESGDQAIGVMLDPKVREITDASIENMGFVVLHWRNYGERNILNNKRAIQTPADMEGIKIRVMQSPALVKAIEALGASPITLAWTECYTGMQQGTIDAIENSIPVVASGGYEEVGKYYSMTKHFIVPDPVLLSKVVYDSLPADLQEACMKAGKDTEAYWNGDIWPASMESDLKVLEDAGVEINTPELEPFMEIAQQVNQETIASFNERQKELYDIIIEVKDQYK